VNYTTFKQTQNFTHTHNAFCKMCNFRLKAATHRISALEYFVAQNLLESFYYFADYFMSASTYVIVLWHHQQLTGTIA